MPIAKHPPARRRQIADALGIDDQYAYQIISGIRVASPALARAWSQLEPADALWDLRPDDWHRIWPELIGADGAPPVIDPTKADSAATEDHP